MRVRVLRPCARAAAVVAASAALVAAAACSALGQKENLVTPSVTALADEDIDLAQARSENQNRQIEPSFLGQIVVFDDPSGIQSARRLFPATPTLIVAEDADAPILRAASLAVAQRVPVVVYDDARRGEIRQLIEDLGVSQVVLVGDVAWARSSGTLEVVHDPGTSKAMGQFTAFQFTSKVVPRPEAMVGAIAALKGQDRTELKAAWEPLMRDEDAGKVPPVTGQSRRDSQMAPNMIATTRTPLANVINANAYGGQVMVMPTSDVMGTKSGAAMVVGLEDGPLVALGPEFGSPKEIGEKIARGYRG